MKIYSWNIAFRNQKLDRAFSFIAESDFDIFCLQEVPEPFLARLRTLPYHSAHTLECVLSFRGVPLNVYSVILSKNPVTHHGIIPLKRYASERPWRAYFLEQFMYVSRLWAKHAGDRHALYADVATDTDPLRVYNLHLPLMYPSIRREEFERVILERDPALPTIVCGDFNVLEKPHITPLNWLFGGQVGDALWYRRERTRVEQRFFELKLTNPLRGSITHPFSLSQLDHILVSPAFTIKKATVIRKRFGSDHRPICVDIG